MRSIPDGYLGTIRTRRDDRGRPNSTSEQVLNGLKIRASQRGYQRGVHRGERIDQNDYYLPAPLAADRGIKRQMAAARKGVPVARYAPSIKLAPAPHLPNDGKAGPTVKSDSPYQVNQVRQSQLRNMKPSWS